MSAIVLGQGDALLIVDLQVDFLPGGKLGVPHGDGVIAPINRLIELYRARALPVYASRDWHPELHCSFVDQGGPWPPHCVAGTEGAGFSSDLNLADDVIVVSKADTVDVDAYSAFSGTGLAPAMRERGIRRVAVCGLATDYCVLNTVLDGLADFEILIVAEAMRAVDVQPGDGDHAMTRMLGAGAVPVRLSEHGLVADVALGARL
jgi:nicotinamidase/pyrazinamidase